MFVRVRQPRGSKIVAGLNRPGSPVKELHSRWGNAGAMLA